MTYLLLEQHGVVVGVPVDVQSVWSSLQVTCCAFIDLVDCRGSAAFVAGRAEACRAEACCAEACRAEACHAEA